MSIIELILKASIVVQLVMLLLVLASIICWAIIFSKSRHFKIVNKSNQLFLDEFWRSKSLDEVFNRIDRFESSPIANMFKAGFTELKKIPSAQSDKNTTQAVDTIQRALRRSSNQEIAELDKALGFLASTASSAPFIGLFGTVWGIMTSFQDIGAKGSANLSVVAPGISEALVATAMGLAAAIPAVIAYNHYVNLLKRVSVDMDNFSQDFLNIVERSVAGQK